MILSSGGEDNELCLNSVSEAEAVVKPILQSLPVDLVYHSGEHTLGIVYPQSVRLAEMEGLSKDEIILLSVAALFHDTGFTVTYASHEMHSAQMAYDYATSSQCEVIRNGAQIIANAILCTNLGGRLPENPIEFILRDADLSPLGLECFPDWNKRLQEECRSHRQAFLHPDAQDDYLWAQMQVRFFREHEWFTTAAKALYDGQKQLNLSVFAGNHGYPLAA
jgi:hypothetical protein